MKTGGCLAETPLEILFLSALLQTAFVVGAVVLAHLSHKVSTRRTQVTLGFPPTRFLLSYVFLFLGYWLLLYAIYIGYGMVFFPGIPVVVAVAFVLSWLLPSILLLAFGFFQLRKVLIRLRPIPTAEAGR